MYTQLPDGRWVPAQPLPFYRDTRSFWIKVWHTIILLKIGLFTWNKKKKEKLWEEFDIKVDEKYMVPVEPYTDKNGKWHRW